MKKITFQSKAAPIKLTISIQDTKILDDIEYLVNLLEKELDPLDPKSSAYKFSIAQENFPFFVKPEFVKFIQINMKISELTQNKFQPFGNLNIFDYLKIIPENNSLIFSKNIKLKAHMLRSEFILDTIDHFLMENSAKSYLIQSDGISIARGDREWTINLEDAGNIKLKIIKESVYIYNPNNKEKSSHKPSGFYISEESLNVKSIILQGSEILKLKALSYMLKDCRYSSEFEVFGKKWNIGIVIVSTDGNIHKITTL